MADESKALVPVGEGGAIVNNFGVGDGGSTLTRATAIANELAGFVRQRAKSGKPIVINIQGKNYPLVECWTTMGAMMGVFPQVESVIECGRWSDGDYIARARVVAKTLSGATVGAGESICSQAEIQQTKQGPKARWNDQYAVFSMAQTRAISKSLRMPLGWVVQLAGFEPTPAEEVPEDGFKKPAHSSSGIEGIYTFEAMQDLMASPTSDEAGNVIVDDDMKRKFVWSAAVMISTGDIAAAETLTRSWGSFTGKDGNEIPGPLPLQTKRDGTLSMSGKWLNKIFGSAKEAFSQWEPESARRREARHDP